MRFMLQHWVPFGLSADMARWMYGVVTDMELGLSGRARSSSRISVITGLFREQALKQKIKHNQLMTSRWTFITESRG